ncbi:MAG: hypothetical protein HKN99_00020, partial [Winogradskyella sp.]|nr:hypothetical protein [Winogradskyella sp.]
TITAPSFDITEITDPKALITKEYLEANSTSATGLEAINEGNGTGWRLVGRDPGNYGNIGENAVDLSTSTFVSTTGALGSFSTAMGGLTTASGSNSTAMGYRTIASGTDSFAAGSFATASGAGSIAMGSYVIADDGGSTVVGQYNDNTTTTTSLFQVGNGTNDTSRSNALTILESGEHTINSTGTGLIINPGSGSFDDGVQVISPGRSGVYVASPSGNGVQVFNPGENGIEILTAGENGVYVQNATDYGGNFTGDLGGVRVNSFNETNPDIILGGVGSVGTFDDGIISSDPNYSGSDIFLRSYDAVSVFLDYDNNETGQFEIKAGDGSEIFEVSETGNATLAGTLTQNSDRRLKKDITAINYGLNEILQLQPKVYNWINRKTEKKSLGLIAQEVQPIISEIVNAQDDEQKTLGISYTELIPVLIKAIQEQQAIIDNQKQVITSQEQTNTKQTDLLQALLVRVEALEKQSKKSHIELAKN